MREKDGIHALGMVVKLPAGAAAVPATQPADSRDAAVPAAAPVAAATPPSAPTAPREKPKGEMRIDKLVVSGADILIEDHSTEPAMSLPIEGLEVEARDLSNLALYETRPIRYSAVVNSGKITLPKKLEGGALPGALGDLSAVVNHQQVKSAGTEQRELFAQAAASGRLVLYPELDGWTKASVSGLELAGLAGPAKQSGVNLSAGTFDDAVDARFKGGSLDSRNRFVFTDLGVTEPPDGPIFRFLHLPAPLDAVIGAMQSADGSITVPLDVPVEKGKLDKGAVVGSAVGAIGPIIATAIASTPVKAVTGVAGIFGLAPDKKQAHEEPVVLSFPAGYSGVEPAEQAKLVALLARLKKDPTLEVTLKHELGGGDVGLAEARPTSHPLTRPRWSTACATASSTCSGCAAAWPPRPAPPRRRLGRRGRRRDGARARARPRAGRHRGRPRPRLRPAPPRRRAPGLPPHEGRRHRRRPPAPRTVPRRIARDRFGRHPRPRRPYPRPQPPVQPGRGRRGREGHHFRGGEEEMRGGEGRGATRRQGDKEIGARLLSPRRRACARTDTTPPSRPGVHQESQLLWPCRA